MDILYTFTATETVWHFAPLPAVVAEAAESIEDLWDKIDASAAAIVERFPEYHEAMRVFFLDLRDRIYGPREP